MAITKTVFTGTTQAANAAEVYAFLNANKSGYFDSVTIDETTDLVTCTVDDVPCLKLGFNNSGNDKSIKITAANETYSENTLKSIKWEYAYVTSKGLWLYSNALVTGGTPAPCSIFITKSDSGDTAIVSIFDSSTAGQMYYITADVLNDSVVSVYKGNGIYSQNTTNVPYIIFQSGVTALTPILLTANNTSYTPALFFTLYSQYRFTPSVLTIGGTRYVYDGRIALRE